MGAFCTIVFVALSAIYLYSRIDHLIDANKDVEPVQVPETPLSIISNLAEDALTSEDTFSAKNGLFFAIALVDNLSDEENIEDPSYGSLQVFRSTRRPDQRELQQIQLHRCTLQELGLA